MALRILTDEHVDRSYVTVLRSNGYDVATADDGYPAGTPDDRLLSIARSEDRVVLTNDRDVASLAERHDHHGVVVYDQGVPPSSVRAGIERIERHVPVPELDGTLLWLSEWIP